MSLNCWIEFFLNHLLPEGHSADIYPEVHGDSWNINFVVVKLFLKLYALQCVLCLSKNTFCLQLFIPTPVDFAIFFVENLIHLILNNRLWGIWGHWGARDTDRAHVPCDIGSTRGTIHTGTVQAGITLFAVWGQQKQHVSMPETKFIIIIIIIIIIRTWCWVTLSFIQAFKCL